MTKTEANKLAAIIAKGVGAVKGTAHIGTWLNVPGISIEIHLDKKPDGRRYAIHNVVGETHCTVRLIDGDGRYVLDEDTAIGTVTFDSYAIVQAITDAMPEPEYCAYCRRSVDRGEDMLEFFDDGTMLHTGCAIDLRAEDQLPALWESHCNGLDTYNQVAVTNGKETIVLANLTQFEKSLHHDELWSAGCAFANAYAAALNSAPEEN